MLFCSVRIDHKQFSTPLVSGIGIGLDLALSIPWLRAANDLVVLSAYRPGFTLTCLTWKESRCEWLDGWMGLYLWVVY